MLVSIGISIDTQAEEKVRRHVKGGNIQNMSGLHRCYNFHNHTLKWVNVHVNVQSQRNTAQTPWRCKVIHNLRNSYQVSDAQSISRVQIRVPPNPISYNAHASSKGVKKVLLLLVFSVVS
jgi:hypothetical protein